MDVEEESTTILEDELRQRILREQPVTVDIEKMREKDLDEESARLEAEIQEDIRGFF